MSEIAEARGWDVDQLTHIRDVLDALASLTSSMVDVGVINNDWEGHYRRFAKIRAVEKEYRDAAEALQDELGIEEP